MSVRKYDKLTFCNIVRRLRGDLTRPEFARFSGVCVDTLYNLEHFYSKKMSSKTAVRLAAATGRDPRLVQQIYNLESAIYQQNRRGEEREEYERQNDCDVSVLRAQTGD